MTVADSSEARDDQTMLIHHDELPIDFLEHYRRLIDSHRSRLTLASPVRPTVSVISLLRTLG
jgi:hypothetical protein